MTKDRFFRLESSTAQEFVIIAGGEPGPEHGIDRRKWPTITELSQAEFEARKGERKPDAAAAEERRRATRIQFLTLGEIEDMIDARIAAWEGETGHAR